jgi:hypothetical protein
VNVCHTAPQENCSERMVPAHGSAWRAPEEPDDPQVGLPVGSVVRADRFCHSVCPSCALLRCVWCWRVPRVVRVFSRLLFAVRNAQRGSRRPCPARRLQPAALPRTRARKQTQRRNKRDYVQPTGLLAFDSAAALSLSPTRLPVPACRVSPSPFSLLGSALRAWCALQWHTSTAHSKEPHVRLDFARPLPPPLRPPCRRPGCVPMHRRRL